MDMDEAFDLTLKKFGIGAVDLSILSGIDASDISRFRNGHQNMGYQKVQRLLKSLDPVPRSYFWILFNCEEQERNYFL